MAMFNPMLVEKTMDLGRGRYEQALREAEMARVLRAATPHRRGVRVRALVRVADALIGLGQGLKARYPLPDAAVAGHDASVRGQHASTY
jgi:hypothetical protein